MVSGERARENRWLRARLGMLVRGGGVWRGAGSGFGGRKRADLSSRWAVGPARRTRRGEAGRSSCAEARAVDPGVPQQRCRTGNSWATVIVVNVTFYSLVTYSEQRKH